MKHFLPKLISENQGGFIEKTQIVDKIILVQEAVHSSKANKDKGLIIKLYMANPFDRVRHSFLFDILFKFGLCPSFQ